MSGKKENETKDLEMPSSDAVACGTHGAVVVEHLQKMLMKQEARCADLEKELLLSRSRCANLHWDLDKAQEAKEKSDVLMLTVTAVLMDTCREPATKEQLQRVLGKMVMLVGEGRYREYVLTELARLMSLMQERLGEVPLETVLRDVVEHGRIVWNGDDKQ